MSAAADEAKQGAEPLSPLSPDSMELGRKTLAMLHYFFGDLRHVFMAMDKDKNSTVDWDEFSAATRTAKIPISEEALKIAFGELDVNRSGELDYGELCRRFSSVALRETVDELDSTGPK